MNPSDFLGLLSKDERAKRRKRTNEFMGNEWQELQKLLSYSDAPPDAFAEVAADPRRPMTEGQIAARSRGPGGIGQRVGQRLGQAVRGNENYEPEALGELDPATAMVLQMVADPSGPLGDAAKVAPALGLLALPKGLRRYWDEAGGAVQGRVLHGTQRTFDNPEERFLKDGNWGRGYYTTTSPEIAGDYADNIGHWDKASGTNPQVRSQYTQLRKPWKTDEPLSESEYNELLGVMSWAREEEAEKLRKRIYPGQTKAETYRDLLDSLGYDNGMTNMVLDAVGYDGIIDAVDDEIVTFDVANVFGGPDGMKRLFQRAQEEGFQFEPDEMKEIAGLLRQQERRP